MRSSATFCVLLAVLAGSAAQSRGKTLPPPNKDGLSVPGTFSDEEKACAACEAIARTLEGKMADGEHHGGAYQRETLLAELCKGIERNVPSHQTALAAGEADVLQFFPMDESMAARLREQGKHPEMVPNFGLPAFCEAFLEEHEDALASTVMVDAEHRAKAAATAATAGRREYDLKAAVCVDMSGRCTAEQLERIVKRRAAGTADISAEVAPEKATAKRTAPKKTTAKKPSDGKQGDAPTEPTVASSFAERARALGDKLSRAARRIFSSGIVSPADEL